MGKKREVEIEPPLINNERIARAQKALRTNNWRDFKKIFEEDKRYLLEDFDLFGNTAINVAPRFNNQKLLMDLLEMLPEEGRWDALRKKNREKNTLLHEVALQEKVEMIDVVFEFEKKAVPPPTLVEEHRRSYVCLKGCGSTTTEEDDVSEEEKRRPLLEIKNQQGETPLFRAARFGKLNMLNHMAKHVADRDMEIHLRNNKQTNILHASVIGEFFDVALWIMKREYGSALAKEKDEKGLTCLQLLSRMPRAFPKSDETLGNWEKLLHKLLPKKGYEDESDQLLSQNRDLESGQQDDVRPRALGLSRINYVFWKYLAKKEEFSKIRKSWEKKNKQKLAKHLAKELVKKDHSWRSYYSSEVETIQLPPVLYNVPQTKKKIEHKEKWREKQECREGDKGKQKDPYYNYTPLLVAASYGIIDIVEIFLREQPWAINHMSGDQENVLHMAVKHRHEEIYKLLKGCPEFESLAAQISKEGRTILHQVASMKYYRAPRLAGAAYQLQSELEWYKRVEEDISSHFINHCDKVDSLTAGDVLDIEHDDMLRDAQTWTKETAQSCSVVAVLVATVVFAAAYAIPGGSERGTPALLGSPLFIFFTIMDILALALSLASVVMFLSVLTSPFELWDFRKSLPLKLKIGFGFMFSSLIATMLAFSATILLTIKLQWKDWSSTLIYTAALFPVTIFAVIQFPFYKNLPLTNKIVKKLVGGQSD